VIDEEVARLLGEADARATSLLESHRAGLDKVVSLLLERETIDGGDVVAAVRGAATSEPPPRIEMAVSS
jgi:cell division protease FtsH